MLLILLQWQVQTGFNSGASAHSLNIAREEHYNPATRISMSHQVPLAVPAIQGLNTLEFWETEGIKRSFYCLYTLKVTDTDDRKYSHGQLEIYARRSGVVDGIELLVI